MTCLKLIEIYRAWLNRQFDIFRSVRRRLRQAFIAKKIAREIDHRQFGFTVFHNSRNGAHRNLYIKGYG